MKLRFQFNDGGRAQAGYKGSTGDCVTRAIAIATGKPYSEVYEAIAVGVGAERVTKHRGASGKRTARSGVHVKRKWFKEYMQSLGWKFTPTMSIGSGCKVHLAPDELPMGRLIVSVSKHYVAVIDGVIHVRETGRDASMDSGRKTRESNHPADRENDKHEQDESQPASGIVSIRMPRWSAPRDASEQENNEDQD